MGEKIIKLKDVSKAYAGVRVLHGIELEVATGELMAVVGTSGSGKSTLLNIIGGLDTRFSGQATVAGQRVDQLGDSALSTFRNRKIGFVFQQFNLLDHLSCAENVAVPATFARAGQGDARPRAVASLERVGMASRADDLPANLSGGQKQRVAIARALFNQPTLLLCDEPTGNLDLKTGQQIIDLFCQLNGEDGRTLIIVTHEDRVSGAAHRVVRLEDGKIVKDEATA
jgi:putative ABC transport system ATP-binding protein